MEQVQENVKVLNINKHKKDTFMSVREFSKTYGIGISKSYELFKCKGAPIIKNGNRILIVRSQVDQWIIDNIGLEF